MMSTTSRAVSPNAVMSGTQLQPTFLNAASPKVRAICRCACVLGGVRSHVARARMRSQGCAAEQGACPWHCALPYPGPYLQPALQPAVTHEPPSSQDALPLCRVDGQVLLGEQQRLQATRCSVLGAPHACKRLCYARPAAACLACAVRTTGHAQPLTALRPSTTFTSPVLATRTVSPSTHTAAHAAPSAHPCSLHRFSTSSSVRRKPCAVWRASTARLRALAHHLSTRGSRAHAHTHARTHAPTPQRWRPWRP